jgi:hypothetical protein
VTNLTAWLNSVTSTEAVLPGYRQDRSALRRGVSKTLFYSVITFMGLFYGLCVAILPPIFLLYFSFPIILIAVLVLWALPDVGRGPIGFVTICLFGFSAVVMMWPDYMAIQVPGFAWISFRRIWSWLMGAGLLLCFSMSGAIRRQMGEQVRIAKPFWVMAGLFFLMQWLTIPMSGYMISSLNLSLNQLFVWGMPLVASSLLLGQLRNLQRWERLLLIGAFVNCVIAVLEYYNRGILWANHIPSFLQVQDEVLQRILEGAIRDGQYRTTSIFTVSLCLAEFLTVPVAFILRRGFTSENVGRIVFWGIADLLLLGAIVLTNSRLGIVGWMVSHLVFVLLWGLKRWRTQKGDLIGPAISFAYPFAAIALLVAMFTVPAVRNRTIGGGSTGYSDQARQEQFHLFWPKLFRNPFGHGNGQSGEILQFRQPGGLLSVDSYFITVGLDYGLLGLVGFFGMIIYAFTVTARLYLTSDSKEAQFALPLACTLAAMFFIRLVLSQLDNLPLLCLVLGMAVAVHVQAVKRRQASLSQEPQQHSTAPALPGFPAPQLAE